jgi:hypothetical protein
MAVADIAGHRHGAVCIEQVVDGGGDVGGHDRRVVARQRAPEGQRRHSGPGPPRAGAAAMPVPPPLLLWLAGRVPRNRPVNAPSREGGLGSGIRCSRSQMRPRDEPAVARPAGLRLAIATYFSLRPGAELQKASRRCFSSRSCEGYGHARLIAQDRPGPGAWKYAPSDCRGSV